MILICIFCREVKTCDFSLLPFFGHVSMFFLDIICTRGALTSAFLIDNDSIELAPEAPIGNNQLRPDKGG